MEVDVQVGKGRDGPDSSSRKRSVSMSKMGSKSESEDSRSARHIGEDVHLTLSAAAAGVAGEQSNPITVGEASSPRKRKGGYQDSSSSRTRRQPRRQNSLSHMQSTPAPGVVNANLVPGNTGSLPSNDASLVESTAKPTYQSSQGANDSHSISATPRRSRRNIKQWVASTVLSPPGDTAGAIPLPLPLLPNCSVTSLPIAVKSPGPSDVKSYFPVMPTWSMGAVTHAPEHSAVFSFNRGRSSSSSIATVPITSSAHFCTTPFAFENSPSLSPGPINNTNARLSSEPSSSSGGSSLSYNTSFTWTSAAASSITSAGDLHGHGNPSDKRSPTCSPRSTSSVISISSRGSQSSSSSRSRRRIPKRASEGALIESARLKKRKVSHHIRSFLLLRPPGGPRAGVDGAADMQAISRAPAWLKNATSQLSRESRMCPEEWEWTGSEVGSRTWTITVLENMFGEALKLNTASQDLAYAEARTVAEHEQVQEEERQAQKEPPAHHKPCPRNVNLQQQQRPGLYRLYDSEPLWQAPVSRDSGGTSLSLSIEDGACSSREAGYGKGTSTRQRQSSAPPTLQGDERQDKYRQGDGLVGPHHGLMDPPTRTHNGQYSNSDATPPPPPPEVLKNQLLAVLRSRLPENARSADAPLRMKKFVVWNAWVRRSTLLTSRRQYGTRSAAPELQQSNPPKAATLQATAAPAFVAQPSAPAAPATPICYPYTDERAALAAKADSPSPPPMAEDLQQTEANEVGSLDTQLPLTDTYEFTGEDFDPFTMFDDDENDDDMFNELEEALHINLNNPSDQETPLERDMLSTDRDIESPGAVYVTLAQEVASNTSDIALAPISEGSTLVLSPSPTHSKLAGAVFVGTDADVSDPCTLPTTIVSAGEQDRPMSPLRSRILMNQS